jgi:hypothetical protein
VVAARYSAIQAAKASAKGIPEGMHNATNGDSMPQVPHSHPDLPQYPIVPGSTGNHNVQLLVILLV